MARKRRRKTKTAPAKTASINAAPVYAALVCVGLFVWMIWTVLQSLTGKIILFLVPVTLVSVWIYSCCAKAKSLRAHELEQRLLAHQFEQRRRTHELEQSRLAYQFEQSRRAYELEQSRRAHALELELDQRRRALELHQVDDMPGHEFERYVAHLMQEQGFTTTVTPGSNDFGVDVVAKKDDIAYAVQCKRYGDNVSRNAVSDAVGGKMHYKCAKAMVVTNRYFTAGAKELAKSTDCILVDRDALADWILDFQSNGTLLPRKMPCAEWASKLDIGLSTQ